MDASKETLEDFVDFRKAKRLGRIQVETPVSHLSKTKDVEAWAWFNDQSIDPDGDPLVILVAAEEGDENACALMRGEGRTYPLLPRAA